MRVLIAYHGTPPRGAGADAMACRTADALARLGHEIAVVTVAGTGAGHRLLAQVLAGPDGRDALASAAPWPPDVVHTFDLVHPRLAAVAADLAAETGAVHALTPASAPSTWRDRSLGLSVARRADVIFALTAAEAETLVHAAIARRVVRITPQGADLAEGQVRSASSWPTGLPPSAPVVLYLGRKAAFKGYRRLLAAAPLVWAAVPDARFVFAGPACDPDVEEVFASSRDERITDFGYVDDERKLDLIDRADVVCLPSEADVFPLVFAEAWARGKPVVSGRFHGADQVVHHGVDGLVVDTEPPAVAAALVQLLQARPECRRLGDNGRRRFEQSLSWPAIAAVAAAAYAETIAGRVARRPAPFRTPA